MTHSEIEIGMTVHLERIGLALVTCTDQQGMEAGFVELELEDGSWKSVRAMYCEPVHGPWLSYSKRFQLRRSR